MSGGWFKVHRSILDNPVVTKDGDHLAVWVFLLSKATHQEIDILFEGKRFSLNPGQLVTSRASISKLFDINESKVQRILKTFEIEQQIEQQTTRHNRLISVLNWDLYQNDEQQTGRQLNDNRTTTEQQLNDNRTTTEHKQEQENKRTEEQKNRRTRETRKTDVDLSFVENAEILETFKEFVDHRKQIKSPLTQLAAVKAYQQLKQLSASTDEQIEILNKSIASGWKGLFALDEKKKSQAQTGAGRWDKYRESSGDFKTVFDDRH
jgi:hypothetical protein